MVMLTCKSVIGTPDVHNMMYLSSASKQNRPNSESLVTKQVCHICTHSLTAFDVCVCVCACLLPLHTFALAYCLYKPKQALCSVAPYLPPKQLQPLNPGGGIWQPLLPILNIFKVSDGNMEAIK